MNPYSPPAAIPDQYHAPPYALSSNAVSDAAVELLRQTRPWVVLLSVFAFIGCAVMILIGLSAAGFALLVPGGKAAPAALMGLIYLPLAFVYIYPGIKLWKFGAAIARLMGTRAGADLEDALGQQKSFWKFSGIATVVLLVLYAVGIAVFVAVGALAAAGMGKLGQ
jgi:Family of unknown function (DUF5362)